MERSAPGLGQGTFMSWQSRFAFQNRSSDISQIYQRAYHINPRPNDKMLRRRYTSSAGKIERKGELWKKQRTRESRKTSENMSITDCYKTHISWCDNIYFSLFSQSHLVFYAKQCKWQNELNARFSIIKSIWKSFWHLLCCTLSYIRYPAIGNDNFAGEHKTNIYISISL